MKTKIFVYGSLKEGYSNHRHIPNIINCVEAITQGKLYSLGSVPLMQVPNKSILIDLSNPERPPTLEVKDFNINNPVYGELITIPTHDIGVFDTIEGFALGEVSVWNRCAIPVLARGKVEVVWAYIDKGYLKEYGPFLQVKSGIW